MKNIKKLRKEIGLKQYVLADALGIDRANYSNTENGVLIPKSILDIEKRAYQFLEPMAIRKIQLLNDKMRILSMLLKS